MSSTNEDVEIGRRLAQLRSENKLSQQGIANLLRVSLRTYQNYERGDRPVSKDLIVAAKACFGISYDWLLTGEAEKKGPPVRKIDEDSWGSIAIAFAIAHLAWVDRDGAAYQYWLTRYLGGTLSDDEENVLDEATIDEIHRQAIEISIELRSAANVYNEIIGIENKEERYKKINQLANAHLMLKSEPKMLKHFRDLYMEKDEAE